MELAAEGSTQAPHPAQPQQQQLPNQEAAGEEAGTSAGTGAMPSRTIGCSDLFMLSSLHCSVRSGHSAARLHPNTVTLHRLVFREALLAAFLIFPFVPQLTPAGSVLHCHHVIVSSHCAYTCFKAAV